MRKFYQNKVRIHCRILFLLAVSIILMSCMSLILENPSFTLHEITLKPHSFTEMNLLLGLDIQNPNRFDLTLKSFGYTVYLNNEAIGNGRLEKELLIPSSSTTRGQVSVMAKFKDLSGSLKFVLTGDDLPYKIEGNANVSSVLGNYNFHYSKEGRINLIDQYLKTKEQKLPIPSK